ncbi:MAG: acyl-protein synthase [Bdellovibrionales bacterium GWA2_49_15]|nr:MAG: acyl-protein synthase [Bdellovibrionales bacterium GWA2_49_15]HAZ11610.1 acyl-protein synthase [Bdellovibrionales bacterium]
MGTGLNHIPDQELLSEVSKVCSTKGPYVAPENFAQDFKRAMIQNIHWHRQRNIFYRNLLDAGRWIDSADLSLLPFIHANFFKKHEVISISKEQVFLHLTSSGTTGQKSQIFFDEWTIKSAQKMVDWIFEYYGLVSADKANYLLYTYEPEGADKLGTAYTDNFLCKYAPVNKVFYALRAEGGGKHSFDLFGTLRAIDEFAHDGLPLRILGFPAFLNFTLDKMRELKRGPYQFHADSMTFLGGGWKGHQDKAISKAELYAKAEELLGFKNARLRDGYGSVEHCIPYVECAHHNFHIPIWSKVLTRDPATLQVLPYGQPGFLQFISPYITSVPANSVLMGDLAILHGGTECGCGLKADYFEIAGRAGVKAGKSCAVSALEILKRSAGGQP